MQNVGLVVTHLLTGVLSVNDFLIYYCKYTLYGLKRTMRRMKEQLTEMSNSKVRTE